MAAFVVIAIFFVVELGASWYTGSLALLSDAWHMLTDVLGIGMALAAVQLAARYGTSPDRVNRRHTFGLYRLEIVAALLNAVLLFGVAIWVLVESVRRLSETPEVLGGPMLLVAVAGLAANLVAFALLREGARDSLNLRGAYLEVVADTIGSVGVIVAAVLIQTLGWVWADPVIGALIGLWILPRTWKLGAEAIRILLQSAPSHIDVGALSAELAAIPGVTDVHDLHVWTLTSEMEAASAHLMVTVETDGHAVLDAARRIAESGYRIDHGTFQVEPESHAGCREVAW